MLKVALTRPILKAVVDGEREVLVEVGGRLLLIALNPGALAV